MVNHNIKNLIFDLGGVILDLSVDHTLQAFSDLARLDKEHVQKIFIMSPAFNRYEKGEMSDDDFRNFVRQAYQIEATDDAIDTCWNAMLRGLPLEKLELLTRLMKSYNVILLSNTNNIHLSYINTELLYPVAQVNSLEPFFHRTYYSHLMNMRKPDAEIFEHVLKENNLIAAETLFLDDNLYNIEGAQSVGIQTVHVTSPDLILDYFHE